MFCQQSESNEIKVDHQDDEDYENEDDNNEILLENQIHKNLLVENDVAMDVDQMKSDDDDDTNNDKHENDLPYFYNPPYLQ